MRECLVEEAYQQSSTESVRLCAWNGVHPGLLDRALLNYKAIENADKVRKKTFIFYYVTVKHKLLGEQTRAWSRYYARSS